LYFPASINTERTIVTTWISNRIQEGLRNNWNLIVLGDFNAIVDPKLDKYVYNKLNSNKKLPTSELLKILINHNLRDSYRIINPSTRKFTWNNSRGIHSRIDYIWISHSNSWNILDDEIFLSNLITSSDHFISSCILEIENITTAHTASKYITANRIFDT